MTWLNESDARAQIESAGIIIDGALELARNGKSKRCKVAGMDREKRGWYRLSEWVMDEGVMLIGTYGIFQGDDAGTRKIELSKRCNDCGHEMPLKARECPACHSKAFKSRELTAEQKAAIKAKHAEDKARAAAERAEETAKASRWATAVWRASQECTPADHDYFARKHLDRTCGARIYPGNDGVMLDGATPDDYIYLGQFAGALVVPLCDTDGKVHGIQFILSRELHKARIARTERDKDFWPAGMSAEGKVYILGGSPHGAALVAEGYATAVSLNMATGLPVAVAWNAGNLQPATAALVKRYKRVKWLIAGDDDWLQACAECKQYTPVDTPACAHCGQPHRKMNAGRTRATEAAAASSAVSYTLPKFASRPADKKGPTDFNDLHALEGLNTVREQIEAALDAAGFVVSAQHTSAPGVSAPALARGSNSSGGGEYQPGGGQCVMPDAVSIMPVDDLVDRYIWVDASKKGIVFDTWKKELSEYGKMLEQLPAKSRGDDIKDHPLWQSRACHIDHVGFDPSGKDQDVKLNTWWGWPMTPKRGECSTILDHIYWLCGEEANQDEVYQYLIWWMAYPLQNPGAKHTAAVIMHGPQGTGKSLVFKLLAQIYGEGKPPRLNYSVILDQKALQDNFNAPWENKLFVLTEEAVTSSDKWQLKNELKELVTGGQIRIRKVFTDAYYQKNRINLAFLSNEDQPLPIDNDDRRHLVIYTPPKQTQAYYDRLIEEINDGGAQAFYDYLLNVDLSKFKIGQTPPMTAAKRRLAHVSQGSDMRFIHEWLNEETEWPVCPSKSEDLYQAYLRWCRKNGETRPRPSNYFWAAVAKPESGWHKGKKRIYTNTHYSGETKPENIQIPPHDILVKIGKAKPDGKTDAEWITDSVFDFANALNSYEAAK